MYHNTCFVTESTTSKNDLLKLGIKEDGIITISPGVDHKLFHPSVKSKYPSVVYFGGMRKYKRPHEVLHLLETLHKKLRDIKLIIIGTGPEEEGLKKLSNEMKLQNYVEFKGRISSIELSAIVASSWFYQYIMLWV